jgi:uncharacterized protein (TIGR02996 family)
MNELEGLLDDIRQNPNDDTPRLVAADWYEDAGQPERATLIRMQCEQARLLAVERNPAITREIDRILARHSRKWLGEIARSGTVTWERGFPQTIKLPASKFLARAEQIAQKIPQVQLLQCRSKLQALAECSALRSLRSLELIECNPTPEMLGQLIHSPHLANLRRLVLTHCELQSVHLEAIGQAPVMNQLESLELAAYYLPSDGLRHLQNLNGARLRHLSLRGQALGPEGVEILVQLPGVQNLTELDLSYCQLDERAGQLLAERSPFRDLKVLNLHFSTLHREGATALAGSPILDRVEHLEIGFNEISNQGVQAILTSTRLKNLKQLNISHSEGTTILGRYLAKSPLLRQLRVLAVHYNALRDNGLKTFLQAPDLSQLLALDLRSCDLTFEGARHLADCPQLANLRVLTLSGNDLGAKGATALIRSPALQNLWVISGDNYTFGRRGLERMQTHFGDRLHPH